jgi:FecR-like protein
MKTSTSSAASVNSSSRSLRAIPKFMIAMLAILVAGAIPARAGGQQAVTKWEPEIVRLSFVQGDVRLSRGGKNGADLNSPWEKAETNMPIGEGFSLATGAGRAEIEFETGTVVYLAENSVLEFNRLDSTYAVPITDLELVTGTVTVNARPAPRELFVISTPSERLNFPVAALVRVDSFLDGVTATPENSAGDDIVEYGGAASTFAGGPVTIYANGKPYTVNVPAGLPSGPGSFLARNASNKTHLDGGQPITYQNSKRVTGNIANDSGAPADWDAWVLARVTKRAQEMDAALKASGLSAPVPGLIDMYESGKFYPCAPEGQCWRPNGIDNSDGVIALGDDEVSPDSTTIASDGETSARLIASLGAPIFPSMSFRPLQSQQSAEQSAGQVSGAQQGTVQQPAPGTIPPPTTQKPKVTVYRIRLDECSDEVRRQEIVTDPVTGKKTVLSETIERDPWMWGVCNSGGWIPFDGRYRFVAGRTQHHPVHFMHIGKKDCWVPRNPHDRRGQTPLNLKNGAFAAGKHSGSLQFVKWNPSDKVTVLTTTPKEFRPPTEKPGRIPVQRPEIQARLVTRSTPTTARTEPGTKATPFAGPKTGERTISYNYQSKTFERAGAAPVSGHTSAKAEVVGHFTANGQFNNGANGSSHGNGGGTTAGGRTSGGGNSGGYSGGGHASGGSSGGSSGGHSGGGGSSGGGGGGGGHSGGGGGSSGGGGGGGHSGGGGGSSGGGGGHGH